MNERDRPSTDPELLDALRFDESRGAPAGAALRVRQRLQRTITGFAGDDAGRLQSSEVVPGKARRRTAWARSAALSLAALLLAGGVGAAMHAALAPRARVPATDAQPLPAVTQPRANKGPRPAMAAPPAVESIPTAEPIPEPEPVAAPVPVAPPAGAAERVSPAPAPSSGLAAERALLDRARAAFGAGHFVEAEQALEHHARAFPAGQLAEEREALAVRTLAAHGQGEAARARAARFRERFPKSLFASAVESAVGAIP